MQFLFLVRPFSDRRKRASIRKGLFLCVPGKGEAFVCNILFWMIPVETNKVCMSVQKIFDGKTSERGI